MGQDKVATVVTATVFFVEDTDTNLNVLSVFGDQNGHSCVLQQILLQGLVVVHAKELLGREFKKL